MDTIEQPTTEVTNNPGGGQELGDILKAGLTEKANTPSDVGQAGAKPENNPNSQSREEAEEIEELFGELVIDDAKKLPFKTKEELDSFIERNKDIFSKTGHFLRQSDYTRKAQELKREREAFEVERNAQDESWGENKPDDASMGAFKSLWNVFQYGTPDLQEKINGFMQDVGLLANGKEPVGPLASSDTNTPSHSSPELIALKRELAQIKREHELSQKSLTQKEIEAEKKRAEEDWTDWKTSQSEKNVKITEEIEQAMVPFLMGMQGLELKNSQKLDKAYRLALEELGLTQNEAVSKVFASAKEKGLKTPKAPASKVGGAIDPEPKNLGDILKQGMKSLAS
jgi:hypothetical protein